MTYQTVNPFTNEVVRTYPDATDEELEQALAAGHRRYEEMKAEPVEARSEQLHAVAAKFREHKDELARICTMEVGKLIGEAQGEIEFCAMIADWYADHGARMLAPEPIETMLPYTAEVRRQSVGIVLMVEPWNFPYYQVMRVFAPNFMVGNPTILKHASNVPMCAEKFAEIVDEAGLPGGSFANLFLDYGQVDRAIADSRVQGVALTGSNRGGASVAASAGRALKKSTMELGGMDAFIVLADADMEAVENTAWSSRLTNSGQVCTSSKRFIVMDAVYDEFLAALKEHFAQIVPGDPLEPDTTFAPMNSKKAKEQLQQQVQEGIGHGATVAFRHDPIDLPGQFFPPTILTDVDRDNPLHTTELFGPVGVVYKVRSEDEAVALANDNPYGLGGVLFCGDADHGAEVAARIETGMVNVNSQQLGSPDLPFGGVKMSGYGRELGHAGQMSFVNEKLVTKPKRQ